MFELRLRQDLFYVSHQLVESFPDAPVAWFAVACYYLLLGRLDSARAYFSKATSLDPRFVPAWIGFGHAFAAQDESDQALGAYRTADRLLPGSYVPNLCLGCEYSRSGNVTLAEQHLNLALARHPDPLVFHELGVVAFKVGDYGRALQHFRRCASASEGTAQETWYATLINMGHCYRKMKNWSKAVDHFQVALSVSPGNAATLTAMGFCHHMDGRIDSAIDAYHKALSLAPHDVLINDLLGRALSDSVDSVF
jgi:anaphase-promoting complex subunit 6